MLVVSFFTLLLVESVVHDPGSTIGSSDVHCRECVRYHKLGTFLG